MDINIKELAEDMRRNGLNVGTWEILPPMFEEICECTACNNMFKEMLQFEKRCPKCGAFMIIKSNYRYK